MYITQVIQLIAASCDLTEINDVSIYPVMKASSLSHAIWKKIMASAWRNNAPSRTSDIFHFNNISTVLWQA